MVLYNSSINYRKHSLIVLITIISVFLFRNHESFVFVVLIGSIVVMIEFCMVIATRFIRYNCICPSCEEIVGKIGDMLIMDFPDEEDSDYTVCYNVTYSFKILN